MQKRVLGKGLDALIPKQENQGDNKEFRYMPITEIRVGKYQPREIMKEEELQELVASVKSKGFIQPIVVRKTDLGYEIVAGGRRFAAAKQLKLEKVPVLIKEFDDKDTLVCAIAENLQRKDLNPMEEALAFKRLMDEFNYSLAEIGQMVGKDKTTVANTLRLLKLPQEIQEALRREVLTRSQARTILSVDKLSEQQNLFHQILHENLPVREIEKRAKKFSNKNLKKDPFLEQAEEDLQKSLGTKVQILNKKNNRGKVVIEYYSLEDLDRVIEKLS